MKLSSMGSPLRVYLFRCSGDDRRDLQHRHCTSSPRRNNGVQLRRRSSGACTLTSTLEMMKRHCARADKALPLRSCQADRWQTRPSTFVLLVDGGTSHNPRRVIELAANCDTGLACLPRASNEPSRCGVDGASTLKAVQARCI